MLHHGKEPFPPIWVDVKEGSDTAKEGKKYDRGVYSWLFPYIHIYKKLPFLEDFIKN